MDYFRALNRLWETFASLAPTAKPATSEGLPSRAAAALLAQLLKDLPGPEQRALLARGSVSEFAQFAPSIYDHSVPGAKHLLADMTPEAQEQASAAHDEFKRGWQRWRVEGSRSSDVLRRLSRSTLVVRNNLAHGEKTQRGPDRERTLRNRAVAKVVLPVLEDVIDFLLDGPSRKLATYGTLRPGGPNHNAISVDGVWKQVTLLGSVDEVAGLPAFSYGNRGTTDAAVFQSDDLPSQWNRLDELEGARYERVLGQYREQGVVGVANIYVLQDVSDDW